MEEQQEQTTPVEAQETPTDGEQTPEAQETPEVVPADDGRIAKLNAEAARYRTERNQMREDNEQLAAKVDRLMKGLATLTGQEPEEQADPEEAIAAAIAERDAARQELRAMRVTTDLSAEIGKAGVDPSLTLAVLKADGVLDQLDPTADDYVSQVEAAVAGVVEAHPRLRTQVVPPSSGQAPNPTDTGTRIVTRDDLATMTSAEINQLARDGKLNHLLNR